MKIHYKKDKKLREILPKKEILYINLKYLTKNSVLTAKQRYLFYLNLNKNFPHCARLRNHCVLTRNSSSMRFSNTKAFNFKLISN